LAKQLYALISSGDDGLAFAVDAGGPALIERRADGSVRLLQVGYEKWQRAKERRAKERHSDLEEPGPLPGVPLQVPGASLLPMDQDRKFMVQDRKFNPWVLVKHLLGSYSVAPASNGWVAWVCIDIDAHMRAGESELDARRRAKRVLGEVWRALGCSATRHPPLFRSPGGGYHLYLPLTRGEASVNAEHTWPARIVRAWMEWHLVQAGLELGLGTIEVYPCGRSLRAPCGRGMVLLQATQPDDPSALGLQPWPGTATVHVDWGGEADELTSWSRRVEPTVLSFIEQFEAQRRTPADWLGRPEAAWDPRWACLGWRAGEDIPRWGEIFAGEKNSEAPIPGQDRGSQESDDVLGGPRAGVPQVAGRKGRAGRARRRGSAAPTDGNPLPPSAGTVDPAGASAGGKLVRGRAFMEKVGRLLFQGVTEASTRYDAVLTLTFYWGATCGLSTEETLGRLEAWCSAFAHQGSGLADRPRTLLRTCLREARHYLERKASKWRFRARGGHGGGLGTLRPADQAVIAAVDPRVSSEVGTLLAWLAGRADKRGCVAEPVQVSHGLIERLCGDRRIDIDGDGVRHRAATVALTELERIGVLTMARNYTVGKRGRVWSCWYQFGSGEIPRHGALSAAKWEQLEPYRAAPLVPTPAQLEVVRSTPEGAPSAPVVDVRVLGECVVPGIGLLRALSAGVRGLARTLFVAASGVERPTAAPAALAPWFERQYQMRPLTPGRLRGATAATVLAERQTLSRAELLDVGGGGRDGARATAAPDSTVAASSQGAARAAVVSTGGAPAAPVRVRGSNNLPSSGGTVVPLVSATSSSGSSGSVSGPSSPRVAPPSSAARPAPSSPASRITDAAPAERAGHEEACGEGARGALSESALRAELAELTDPAFAAACDAELLESLCSALRSFRGRGRGS